MKWLVRLYPPAWRARYGDELLAVLQARGVDRSVALDVVRGAIDAWVRGPRGPFGFAGVAFALMAYGLVSWLLAVARRTWVNPIGDPLETLYQSLYWFFSTLFMTWLASRPALHCDLTGFIARLRR